MVPRMQTSDDVLVVGAGPVGMLTALLLHSLGSRVQILERRPARWNLPRAVTCYSQILRILQALGILEECLAAQAIHPFRPELADKAEWMGADGQLVVQIPFNGELSRSGMDVVYGMNQMVLDHVLEKVCADRGVPILRGRDVIGVDDKGTHVELTWKRYVAKEDKGAAAPDDDDDDDDDDEEVHRMDALFVVGCDGAHSAVREAAGIKFIPQTKEGQHRWLVLDVQPKPGTNAHLTWKDRGIFRQYNHPSRPCTSAPSIAARRRIEFLILPHEPSSVAQDDAFVWALLKPWGCHPDNATLLRRTVFSPSGGWAQRFARGRVVLAGDAAHNSPQFLGAGANTGLRDAKSLAWRLHLAAQRPDDVDHERLLQDYATEQHGIATKLVMMAVDLERLIAVTDPEKARRRDEDLMRAAIVEGYPDVESLGPPGMHLRDREVAKKGQDTGGHLFIHDDVVLDGRRGPFDVVVGQGWILLGSGPETPATALESRTLDEYRKEFDGLVAHCGKENGGFEDVSGRYTEWFQKNEACAVLLRPDFYIYGVARTEADIQRIVRKALDHLFPKTKVL